MLPSLKELCLDHLISTAERFLDLQWSDGRFEVTPEHETEVWNQFHQQYVLAAAWLYTADHPANPWYGSARVWEALLRNGRHIASHVDQDGAMLWNLNEHRFTFVDQRLLCAWLLAYEMVQDRLPEAEERLWQGKILRGCEWLHAHHLLPHRHTQDFTAHPHGVNTGTNHFSLYLSLLHRVGRRFDRPEWVEDCTDLMHKLIAAQAPGGYWPEHEGPALGYNYLTCHGVEEYTRWSGEEVGLAALRRGLELHRHWTYPDGVAVECIDGRMRHTGGPFLWNLSGFARWPEGRGYARLLLSKLNRETLSGEGAARLVQAYLMLEEGEEETPPQLREHYRAVLEDTSVVRKEGPWVVALSGQCATKWEDNSFMLDRQCLLGAWREGIGLVLDGSNSKQQPELATFRRGDDHLPLSAQLLPAEGTRETIAAQYATFRGRAQVEVIDARALEVTLSASEGVAFSLVPAVYFGESITLSTARGTTTKTLGEESFSFDADGEGAALRYKGVSMALPVGARVTYPVSPFNSYHARNTSPPGANRLIVTEPVGKAGVRVRLEMEDRLR